MKGGSDDTSFPFLSLPLELRTEVYYYVLLNMPNSEIIHSSSDKEALRYKCYSKRAYKVPSICQVFPHEAGLLFSSKFHFRFMSVNAVMRLPPAFGSSIKRASVKMTANAFDNSNVYCDRALSLAIDGVDAGLKCKKMRDQLCNVQSIDIGLSIQWPDDFKEFLRYMRIEYGSDQHEEKAYLDRVAWVVRAALAPLYETETLTVDVAINSGSLYLSSDLMEGLLQRLKSAPGTWTV